MTTRVTRSRTLQARTRVVQASRQPDLPTEILIKIFSYLSPKETFRSLALCSHQFYDIVAPTLYGNVYVNAGSHGLNADDPSHEGDGLRDATLHLLHKRNFGSFIKHVKLCGPTSDDYERQDSLGSEEDRTLQTAVQKYLRRPENASTKLTQMGVNWLTFNLDDRTTVPVLFMALLPSLVKLYIQIPDAKLLADNLLSLNIFANVREMILEWLPPRRHARMLGSPLTAHHLKDILSIASLHKACIVWLVSQYPLSANPRRTPFCILERTSSKVKTLELRSSRLRVRDLELVLAACPSLDTFVYEQTWLACPDRRSFYPVKLPRVLQKHHENTLENLWVNFNLGAQEPFTHLVPTSESGLDLLHDFKSLKRLCISMEMLSSNASAGMIDSIQQCLPTTLETLVLITHGQSTVLLDSFIAFCRHWTAKRAHKDMVFLPKLQTVVYVAHWNQYIQRSQLTVDMVDNIPDLEVIFAMDGPSRFSKDFENPTDRRVDQIADSMGLTRLAKERFGVVDMYRWGCWHERAAREYQWAG